MRLKNIFEIFGGVFGAMVLFISAIAFFGYESETSLLIGLLTFIYLEPYVTINSFREKIGDTYNLSNAWMGKFGSLLHLCKIINQFWISFLVYKVSGNYWYAIGVFVFQLLILPKIVLKLYTANQS